MKLKALFFLFLASAAFADEGEPLLENLSGIAILGCREQVKREGIEPFCGVHFQGIDVPGGSCLLEEKLSCFLCNPLSQETINEIKREIIRYYRDQNYPVVVVSAPQQELTQGVLQLVVMEGCLGEVQYTGNCWFKTKSLQKYITLCPGEPINSDRLMNDVAAMNRNPFRRTEVVFAPGQIEGTTNIELVTRDKFPIRFYAGADNTGNSLTNNTRLFAGFNAGNLFGLDQVLTYQATVAPSASRFQSHTLHYTAPLPWRHILTLYGGYAWIDPHLTSFHSSGRSAQASVRYLMPVKPLYKSSSLEFTIGYDYKMTNNNILFSGPFEIPVVNKNINISQFVLGVSYGLKTKHHKFSANADFYGSPGKWYPNQSNTDYQELRYKAKDYYVYGRMMVGDEISWPRTCTISLLGRAQFASTNLLPSEEFALGGYDTVRGYNERVVNGDNAFCFNFEIQTVRWQFFNRCGTRDEFYLLAFADYGVANSVHRLPGEDKFQNLFSIGPGLRYSIGSYLSVRADWGYRFVQIQDGQEQGGKFHLGALVSY